MSHRRSRRGVDPSSSESNDPDFDDVQCSQMLSVNTELLSLTMKSNLKLV
jgi:hypothetical protein